MALLRSLALAAVLVLPLRAAALELGDPLGDLTVPTLAGGPEHLVDAGRVNVLVFVRPGHGHCGDALRDLAGRERDVSGVRWAAVVPGDAAPGEVRALLAAAGTKMPALLDRGDAVYGRIGLKLHPTVVVLDRQGRLAGVEPFREINYADRVVARIRFTLGELSEAQLAAALEPPRSDVHSEAGRARAGVSLARKLLAAGQPELALAQLEKSLGHAPSAPAWALKGRILSQQGRCGDAERALDAALKLEPGNAEAAGERGRCTPGKPRAP